MNMRDLNPGPTVAPPHAILLLLSLAGLTGCCFFRSHPMDPALHALCPTIVTTNQFGCDTFTSTNETHVYYRMGNGPPVLILHELPGLSHETFEFGKRVADRGYTVYLPLLFGKADHHSNLGGFWAIITNRGFHPFAQQAASPITRWLDAFCTHLGTKDGNRKVGVIGMCLSGNFVLTLMTNTHVAAAVMSQPALPFCTPFNPSAKSALGVSSEDLAVVKQRNLPFMGLRFSEDCICPKERFTTMEQTFGTNFWEIQIDSSCHNTNGIPHGAHSVLVESYVNCPCHPTYQAFQRVLAFLDERLK